MITLFDSSVFFCGFCEKVNACATMRVQSAVYKYYYFLRANDSLKIPY